MDDADREVLSAENELAVAAATMRATEARGQTATVRAPFNGVVSERFHQPGDAVRPEESDPILRVIDPKQVQVSASVDVTDMTRFAEGTTGRVFAAGSSAPELVHVISRPSPDAGDTRVAVTLTFDAPTELQPGMQVGVEIDAEQRFNVPLVPRIAVLKDTAGNPYVMIAALTIAQRRPVVVGIAETELVEIRSGVKPGELVITQGHSSLRDGAPITVSPP
jgi:RND family efflux transporter MFP subunit